MEKFKNLPGPVKGGAAAGGAGGLFLTGLAAGGKLNWMFLVILCLFIIILVGGFLLWTAWKKRKQNARFGGELQQHSAASPRGISDPGQRARLDDMRKKFEQGVHEYRSRGKDIYTLPWYVIVGEPGSGKTEAVRHSNVGFPPGMQDEFQGVGGTINMNWWFTNHAVLLDTAGRLMFEEVKPGETSEWKEFLTLLKKNRPNCPINGLCLIIPADSLIKDSAEQIAKKAGKIAQQLDVIQRVLDVRFPVFVVITKCDKINGFREFFDGLTDPQLQHQMLGWSNPDSLDTVFRPELVDQHLEQVVQRLRKRRLGLLRDPVPENPNGRRTDEVDALYALPHSLSLIAPRLRRYLETIFVAGEWSAKPLFLRGIYFTSSMREGSALDEELANAIGMPVDALPEGKVWERERAYFLRDVFIEKAFREKSLVTRASNTSQMLRRQQVTLFACGFAALAVFAGLFWLARRNLEAAVESHSKIWHIVSTVGWHTNGVWKQSIIPFNSGAYAETYLNQVTVDGQKLTLGKFHAHLRERAETPLKKSWLIGGLAERYNRDSTNAQRIVFEGGVVRPLVQAAQQKLIKDAPAANAEVQQRHAQALVALITLESQMASAAVAPPLNPASAREWVTTLGTFVAGPEAEGIVDSNLVHTMVATYTRDPKAWPPRTLTGAWGPANTLASNPAIQTGLNRFITNATATLRSLEQDWQGVTQIKAALRQFELAETNLHTAAKTLDAEGATRQYAALEQAKKAVDEALAKTTNASLWSGAPSLAGAYTQYRLGISNTSTASFQAVQSATDLALQANPNHPLFTGIRERLRQEQQSLAARTERAVTAQELEELKRLDQNCLTAMASGALSYAARFELYQQAANARPAKPFNTAGAELVGSGGRQLVDFLSGLAALNRSVATYGGPNRPAVTNITGFFLTRANDQQAQLFSAAYLKAAHARLKAEAGYPLFKNSTRVLTVEQLQSLSVLRHIGDDLGAFGSPGSPLYAWRDRPEWKKFAQLYTQLNTVRGAILINGLPGTCTVKLRRIEDPDGLEKWRTRYRYCELKAEARSSERIQIDGGGEQELGKVPVDKPLSFALFQTRESPVGLQPQLDSWGPVRLILDSRPKRKSDPRAWEVNWPLPNSGTDRGEMRLELMFEGSLPDLDKWPVVESM